MTLANKNMPLHRRGDRKQGDKKKTATQAQMFNTDTVICISVMIHISRILDTQAHRGGANLQSFLLKNKK